MKNDLTKGDGNRMPEKVTFSIILRLLRRLVGRKGTSQSLEIKHRRTKSDGSGSETEFKYQKKDDTGNS